MSTTTKQLLMTITCPLCQRNYDDAVCWTLCSHGPLWAGVDDYCPRCDTVVSVHGPCCHQNPKGEDDAPINCTRAEVFQVRASTAAFAGDEQEVLADLANDIAASRPESQETTVALRKLLEAKDAAARAQLD